MDADLPGTVLEAVLHCTTTGNYPPNQSDNDTQKQRMIKRCEPRSGVPGVRRSGLQQLERSGEAKVAYPGMERSLGHRVWSSEAKHRGDVQVSPSIYHLLVIRMLRLIRTCGKIGVSAEPQLMTEAQLLCFYSPIIHIKSRH